MQLEEHTSLELADIQEVGSSPSLHSLLIVIFRNKWKIVLAFSAISVIGTLIVLFKPEIYQSHAQILIKPGRENISWDTSALKSGISFNRNTDLNAALSIITSENVVRRVVEVVGAEAIIGKNYRGKLEPVVQAIFKVKENLSVNTGKNSNIVLLSFKSEDSRTARDVLDNIINVFMDRHIEVHQIGTTPGFFRKQSEKFFNILEEKEREYKNYCDKHGVLSPEVERNANVVRINDLNESLENIEGSMLFSQTRIISLEENLQDRSEISEISRVTGMANPVADSIRQRLVDLRFREVELANRYPDNSRVLIELRKQISFAKEELLRVQETNTELTTGVDANYQALQLELEQTQASLQALKAQKQFLKNTLEQRKKALFELGDHEVVLSSLQREIDIARSEYDQYRESYQQAKASMELDIGKISNINILQPATLPIKPNDSKKIKGIVLSVALGLFGSFGIAYVREFLDDSIKTNEEVMTRLGLPILASINYK